MPDAPEEGLLTLSQYPVEEQKQIRHSAMQRTLASRSQKDKHQLESQPMCTDSFALQALQDYRCLCEFSRASQVFEIMGSLAHYHTETLPLSRCFSQRRLFKQLSKCSALRYPSDEVSRSEHMSTALAHSTMHVKSASASASGGHTYVAAERLVVA